MEKVKPNKIRKKNVASKKKSEDIFEKKEKTIIEKKSVDKKEDKKKKSEDIFERVNEEKSSDKKSSSKVKGHTIRKRTLQKEKVDVDDMGLDKEDRESLQEDDFSIGVIALILFACVVVGVGVGYILYRLAINSSAVIILPILK